MLPPAQVAPDISAGQAEPIRFPGAVQPHGALLVVHPATGTVVAASESCVGILGHEALSLLGTPLRSLLGDDEVEPLLAFDAAEREPTRTLQLGQQRCAIRWKTADWS